MLPHFSACSRLGKKLSHANSFPADADPANRLAIRRPGHITNVGIARPPCLRRRRAYNSRRNVSDAAGWIFGLFLHRELCSPESTDESRCSPKRRCCRQAWEDGMFASIRVPLETCAVDASSPRESSRTAIAYRGTCNYSPSRPIACWKKSGAKSPQARCRLSPPSNFSSARRCLRPRALSSDRGRQSLSRALRSGSRSLRPGTS